MIFVLKLEELDRYSITGDHSQGHYDLTISNIQLEDEAEFKCQGHIKRPAKVQQLNSKSANLTVISKFYRIFITKIISF